MSTPDLQVSAVLVLGAGLDGAEVLRYAAAVGALSEHPVARAVAAAGAAANAAAASDAADVPAASGPATDADGAGVDGAGVDRADAKAGADPEEIRLNRSGVGEDAPGEAPALPLLEVSGFVEHPGGGVEGLVRRAHAGLAPGGALNTRRVLLGEPDWLAQQGVSVPAEAEAAVGRPQAVDAQHAVDRRLAVDRRTAAGAAVAVAWDGSVRGVITLT